MTISLDMTHFEYKRHVYNFVDFLGELGGILELIVFLCGIIMYPINEHKFYVYSLSKLFIKEPKKIG